MSSNIPSPKQQAAAASYVSELEVNLVASNAEVQRLRVDRDRHAQESAEKSENFRQQSEWCERLVAQVNGLTKERDAARQQFTTCQSVLKEWQSHSAELRETVEAARVFITPLERLKGGWNEFKEDAARRIVAIAPMDVEESV